MTKTPIDIKRDSGGFVHIGTLEDGAVRTMVEIDGSLFIIKEKAIYAVQQADQIDPKRTNIALPNIIPRPDLSEGSDSELVGKTLMTAVTMFDKGKFLPNEFDHAKALSLSLDVLKTMIAMRAGATEFKAAQQKAYARAMSASIRTFGPSSNGETVSTRSVRAFGNGCQNRGLPLLKYPHKDTPSGRRSN